MRRRHIVPVISVVATWVVLANASLAFAKDGKLVIRAKPSQAYVFVDDTAVGDASLSGFRRLILNGVSPGQHKVSIYNYGFMPETRNVEVLPGKTTRLAVELKPLSGEVSGPWGRIQIEGAPRAAVLLNGKTPHFFVGHADEFNQDILWKQELLVPPGTHHITLLRPGDNQEIYSGSVTVKSNQRVIVYVNKNGEQKVRDWPRGEKLKSAPRFKAGLASATVAVGPITTEFSVTPAKLNCGESSELAWTTSGTVDTQISGIGSVSPSGKQSVQPKETTTYKFTASGPGGVYDSSATVTVNKLVTASFSANPQEVKYRRVGDKVVEQGVATSSWVTSNADSISIDPFGSVSASGERTVEATPKKTEPGPIDEIVTYQLTATNACGGSETRTATLHITGSIEPAKSVLESTLETKLALNSIYFPTALPTRRDPNVGLVPSQQRVLAELAENFKKYLEFRSEAHLILEAHADKRGSLDSNKALTDRRANRVKDFLSQQGVSTTAIETKAFGDVKNLDEKEVRELTEQNPALSPEEKRKILRNLRTIVLANNRRVDVVLSTTGQQSARLYPYTAPDSRELLAETGKGKRTVKKEKK